MPNVNRPLRLILLALLALIAAALLWALFGVLHGAIVLWQDWQGLPGWAQAVVAALLAAAILGLAWIGRRLLGPRKRKTVPAAVPKRADVDQRVAMLDQRRGGYLRPYMPNCSNSIAARAKGNFTLPCLAKSARASRA